MNEKRDISLILEVNDKCVFKDSQGNANITTIKHVYTFTPPNPIRIYVIDIQDKDGNITEADKHINNDVIELYSISEYFKDECFTLLSNHSQDIIDSIEVMSEEVNVKSDGIDKLMKICNKFKNV
jgi:hypothetical protein